MKKLLFPLFLLLFAVALQAQIQDPVKFKSELKTLAAGEAEAVFTAAIDKGWHVYSTDLGDGGPISATFNVEKISGAEMVGKLKPVGKEVSTFDKLFEMKVRYFENTAQFVQKLKLTGGDYQIEGIWNTVLAMMKIACRLHKYLSNSQVRQEVLRKRLPSLRLKRKPKNSRESRNLSPTRLLLLSSVVQTVRR